MCTFVESVMYYQCYFIFEDFLNITKYQYSRFCHSALTSEWHHRITATEAPRQTTWRMMKVHQKVSITFTTTAATATRWIWSLYTTPVPLCLTGGGGGKLPPQATASSAGGFVHFALTGEAGYNGEVSVSYRFTTICSSFYCVIFIISPKSHILPTSNTNTQSYRL